MLPREVEAILREMRKERIMGASWLACRAAEAYKQLAETLKGKELIEALKEMRRVVPAINRSMASLYNVSLSMPITGEPSVVKAKAEEFLKLAEEMKTEIGNIGSELIEPDDVVITHSFSSTVFEILRTAKEKGKSFRVILTESSPDYEGLALAGELLKLGVPFEIITDAQLGLFAREATMALVGADSITRDGAVVNKAGTYPLAILCHEEGVPFYSAAESYKIHPVMSSKEVEIEERPYSRGGYGIRNYLFDVTPWKFVRGIITELGILVPPREI